MNVANKINENGDPLLSLEKMQAHQDIMNLLSLNIPSTGGLV